MNSAIKIVVALIVVALIAVIGMIMIANQNASEPAATAATTIQTTAAPEVTTEPEEVQPEESKEPDMTAQDSETSVSSEAQDEAQGTMYEGALAGLSEEEIAKMALAEEQSHTGSETEEEEIGAKDAGD